MALALTNPPKVDKPLKQSNQYYEYSNSNIIINALHEL